MHLGISLLRGTFLLLAREETLEKFRTLFYIHLCAGFKKSITDLSHAAAFTSRNLFEVFLQTRMHSKCKPRIFSHRSKILPLFRHSFAKTALDFLPYCVILWMTQDDTGVSYE